MSRVASMEACKRYRNIRAVGASVAVNDNVSTLSLVILTLSRRYVCCSALLVVNETRVGLASGEHPFASSPRGKSAAVYKCTPTRAPTTGARKHSSLQRASFCMRHNERFWYRPANHYSARPTALISSCCGGALGNRPNFLHVCTFRATRISKGYSSRCHDHCYFISLDRSRLVKILCSVESYPTHP